MALPVRRANTDVARTDVAEVVRWDPFSELERFTDELFSSFDRWRWFPDGFRGFSPPADVEETDDAFIIELELPGVKRDDLDIEVSGRRVSVRGERKERERSGIFRKRERTVGRFSYEVTLPGAIDADDVDAHLDEGVLTVRLAKPASDRPRRIPVH